MTENEMRILLIEDSPWDRRLIGDMLAEMKEEAFVLSTADDLAEGKRLLDIGEIDLVLLDLILPDSEGLDTLHAVLKAAPSVPIVVCSAISNKETALRAVSEGAQDYLIKGDINPSMLVRAIRYARERKRGEEALKTAHDQLEIRVKKRTAELTETNELLRKEIVERKAVEESLTSLRKAVESSAVGITITDLSGIIIYTNPAEAAMHGYTVDELIGFPARMLAPEKIRREMTAEEINAMEGMTRETVNIRKDGATFPISRTTDVVREQNGHPIFVVSISEDITEKRRAEAKIRESEERYRDLVDNMQDLVYVIDEKGNMQFVNQAVADRSGFGIDELQGKSIVDFFTNESLKYLEELYKQRTTGEEVGVYELDYYDHEGNIRTIEAKERPIIEDGKIIEVQGIARDITQRKNVERALRESEQEYRNLVDTISDYLYVVDEKGAVLFANKSLCDDSGYSLADIIGSNIGQFLTPESQELASRLFKRQLAGEEIGPFEMDFSSKQGVIRTVEIRESLVRENGRIVQVRGIGRDVTEQKKLVATTLDSVSDGIIIVNMKDEITSTNAAAERITGLGRERMIGKPLSEILRERISSGESIPPGIIGVGKAVVNHEMDLITASGRIVPVSLSMVLLTDRESKTLGRVVTFRDISVIVELKKEIYQKYTYQDIISKNKQIKEIFDVLPYISESDSTVLIEGKSGTGKELFARAIHNLSPRRKGPFVAVNCAALPDTLLESELFGYVRGAFTNATKDKPGRFALANGGTILLDEIGDMPKALQVKLLRVLEQKEYEPLGSVSTVKSDVRIIASTNREIASEVAHGNFREDLFYRLNVVKIVLPELKERREDIPLLINHFADKFSRKMGKPVSSISDRMLDILMRYDFPGNIRELENIIEHAMVISGGGVLDVQHLPKSLLDRAGAKGYPRASFRDEVTKSEKKLIEETLAKFHGSRVLAADSLNMNRTTLWRKMKRYGLMVEE
ncbi:MAG: PAS domain S-box protein [Deltaproteobacteria bacterium]|nr:PAS domain S-box protein [Candidatus Zymogenaceae bacterium]